MGWVIRGYKRISISLTCHGCVDGSKRGCYVPENGDRIWICPSWRLHCFAVLSFQVSLSFSLIHNRQTITTSAAISAEQCISLCWSNTLCLLALSVFSAFQQLRPVEYYAQRNPFLLLFLLTIVYTTFYLFIAPYTIPTADNMKLKTCKIGCLNNGTWKLILSSTYEQVSSSFCPQGLQKFLCGTYSGSIAWKMYSAYH